ncbi:MAG: hypothetical protein ABEJ83_04690 [Candidatus Nanohaloarchaea archaeon]
MSKVTRKGPNTYHFHPGAESIQSALTSIENKTELMAFSYGIGGSISNRYSKQEIPTIRELLEEKIFGYEYGPDKKYNPRYRTDLKKEMMRKGIMEVGKRPSKGNQGRKRHFLKPNYEWVARVLNVGTSFDLSVEEDKRIEALGELYQHTGIKKRLSPEFAVFTEQGHDLTFRNMLYKHENNFYDLRKLYTFYLLNIPRLAIFVYLKDKEKKFKLSNYPSIQHKLRKLNIEKSTNLLEQFLTGNIELIFDCSEFKFSDTEKSFGNKILNDDSEFFQDRESLIEVLFPAFMAGKLDYLMELSEVVEQEKDLQKVDEINFTLESTYMKTFKSIYGVEEVKT